MATIGVLGASGGVGASTLTAALAVRSRAVMPGCLPVVAVDLDPRGGLDVVLGIEHLPGPRWDDLSVPSWPTEDQHVPITLSSLPADDGVAVLAARSVTATDWSAVFPTLDAVAAQADMVTIDCGPRPPAALVSRMDALVVLGSLTAKGLHDVDVVGCTCALARTHAVLVTRGPRDSRGSHSLAQRLGVPLLAHWADDPRIARLAARGVLPGTRTTSVDAVADEALAMLQTLWLSDLIDRRAPGDPSAPETRRTP